MCKKISRKKNKLKKLYACYCKKGVYIVCTSDFTLFHDFCMICKPKNCKNPFIYCKNHSYQSCPSKLVLKGNSVPYMQKNQENMVN